MFGFIYLVLFGIMWLLVRSGCWSLFCFFRCVCSVLFISIGLFNRGLSNLVCLDYLCVFPEFWKAIPRFVSSVCLCSLVSV